MAKVIYDIVQPVQPTPVGTVCTNPNPCECKGIRGWCHSHNPCIYDQPTVEKVKIIRVAGGGEDLIITKFTDLDDLLGNEDTAPGQELKITFEEMDKKDFDNLPEWSGF